MNTILTHIEYMLKHDIKWTEKDYEYVSLFLKKDKDKIMYIAKDIDKHLNILADRVEEGNISPNQTASNIREWGDNLVRWINV